MAYEIPDHFHKQFTTNVELLLQERKPVMLQGVTMGSYSGEAGQVVKQFGEVEFQEVTSRNSNTNFSNIDHKQRWVFPSDHNLALPVDKEDEIRMLDSPKSPYAIAMRAAYARLINRKIRDAALGSSRTGTNGGTSTAFDTTNQQIVHGSAGLTIAKLITTKEIFGLNEVDEDVPLFMAITQNQVSDLLNDTTLTSADYNTVKALVEGKVDSFMGFKFIRYNSLTKASTTRSCIAWAEGGIHFGQWNDLETHIDVRPDKNYLTQVFMKASNGATRTQEKLVVEVQCTE